ncbi:MAG TPA: PilZ domain-containing protein [Polyangia bacterium]|jgi:hypothetical protein|nr:PilZ domain-containing protein [Polyangia bacterium]
MTPFNEFVRSVQDSFAANRAHSATKLGLVVVATVAVWVGLSVWRRRLLARRELDARINSVIASARLSAADLEDLRRIAAVGEVPLLEAMTVLAQFEHATAKLLAQEAPTIRPALGSWFERVRHLRRSLGFSPLSAHLWLLSTRELAVGDSLAMGGNTGHVAEVNEASFAVDWPPAAVLVQGATLAVTVDRPDDARYVSRVRVLGLEALPATATESGSGSAVVRSFLAHDERPERQQDREYLRLRVNAPVSLQIVVAPLATGGGGDRPAPVVPPTPASPAAPAPTIAGTMVDVSAGGLSLNVPVSRGGPVITRGQQALCWFIMDEHARFEALAAVIVAADPPKGPPPGLQHLRLSFVSLRDVDRDRLAAAVARHQGGLQPPVAGGKA